MLFNPNKVKTGTNGRNADNEVPTIPTSNTDNLYDDFSKATYNAYLA